MPVALLRPEDLDSLIVGVTLLGSGGGGDARIMVHQLRASMPADGVVLHQPEDLGDAMVLAVGMLGGTRVLTEKLPSGGEITAAVRAIARWTGRTADAVMPLEAAGLNAALAVCAALDLGLPLVDADLMGRAMPRLDQLTRAWSGRPITPMALAEPSGQVVVIDSASAVGAERSARSIVAQCGGWAGAAFAPLPSRTLRQDSCVGTLARALDLGRAHARLPEKADATAVAEVLGGRPLAAGRVVDIARHRSATFGRGTVTVIDDDGSVLRVETENEYLLAIVDGVPVASCPDLICLLDRRTGSACAVDGLRPGDDVVAVCLSGPDWWLERPDRTAIVGPRSFGLGCDPVQDPTTAAMTAS